MSQEKRHSLRTQFLPKVLVSWWQQHKLLPVQIALELKLGFQCIIRAVAVGVCVDLALLPEMQRLQDSNGLPGTP